jgi:hypothetical protein
MKKKRNKKKKVSIIMYDTASMWPLAAAPRIFTRILAKLAPKRPGFYVFFA